MKYQLSQQYWFYPENHEKTLKYEQVRYHVSAMSRFVTVFFFELFLANYQLSIYLSNFFTYSNVILDVVDFNQQPYLIILFVVIQQLKTNDRHQQPF